MYRVFTLDQTYFILSCNNIKLLLGPSKRKISYKLMFMSYITNFLLVVFIFTVINLIIKLIINFKNKMNYVVMSYYSYSFKNYDKITHFLYFTNLNI